MVCLIGPSLTQDAEPVAFRARTAAVDGHVYAQEQWLDARVRLAGRVRRAVVTEYRDHGGRRMAHLLRRPTDGAPPGLGWFWWHPRSMHVSGDGLSPVEVLPARPGDAVRLHPAQLAAGPGPLSFDELSGGMLPARVQVADRSHEALILRTSVLADGSPAALVHIHIVDGLWAVHYPRLYAWDGTVVVPDADREVS
ncbi:hypothetical protein [Streptomyces violascens]|uniref:hypothetical protein n=1 Tax=Streptomyces violascens TaxID=67381 RepID=UPI001679EE29|nr:hypothetical protein [Streptomyces violascens]GGU38001.1 hypothetical protein GCM10010289_68690 [Streptomyces violascens]